MTKHDAMVEYVKKKVEDLSFNFLEDVPVSISFLTSYSGKILKKYIRAADKEYGFVIVINYHYSTESDEMNLAAMNFAQKYMDWIDEQEKKKNYPDFGETCQIKKIENLQNMPNLARVDMQNRIATYQMPCRVIYFEKER